MSLTTFAKITHRTPWAWVPLALVFVLIWGNCAAGANPAGDARDLTGSDLLDDFPDRKTGSPECREFFAAASVFLRKLNWHTDVLSYSVLIKAQDQKGINTTFVNVSGDNMVATGVPLAKMDTIDLLIVAPCDTLFTENGNRNILPSYTRNACNTLLSVASKISSSNTALAFVSGHHQYGAGIEGLLDELSAKGIKILSSVIVGDASSTHETPLIPNGNPPSATVKRVYDACNEAGLNVFLAGRRHRTAWYLENVCPTGGSLSPQTHLDWGNFEGEGDAFAKRDIPSVTIGLPVSPQMALPQVDKSQGVISALGNLADSPFTDAGDLLYDQAIFLQYGGTLTVIPAKTVKAASYIVSAVSLLVLLLCKNALGDLSRLALLVGTLLACVLAHLFRSLSVTLGSFRYLYSANPGAMFLSHIVLVLLLVLLGFLRLWNVRTRIHHLHGGAQTAATSLESKPKRLGHAWGLAIMTATLAGLGTVGSEFTAPALLSVLALCLSVLVESRTQNVTSAFVWLARLSALVPSVTFYMQAGVPWKSDSQAAYMAAWQAFRSEGISLLLAFSVSLSCLLSTCEFPRPVTGPRRKILRLSEPFVLVCLVGVLVMPPKLLPSNVPTTALVRETGGQNTEVSVTAPRPLGKVFVEAGTPLLMGEPLEEVQDRTGSWSLKFPVQDTSVRATLSHNLHFVEDGDNGHLLQAHVEAAFLKNPTYYTVTLRDSSYGRGVKKPFNVTNLDQVVGGVGIPEEAYKVDAKPGYCLRIVWWAPSEKQAKCCLNVKPGTGSMVIVTSEAVYVDDLMVNVSFEADNAAFFGASTVTAQSSK